MSTTPVAPPDQSDFLECYRGRQSPLHHAAYMRMGKVLFALLLCEEAGISLHGKEIFDYGFGAGTFFRYCPPNCRIFGVEIDALNVRSVQAMLSERGLQSLDLRSIDLENWASHPLLAKKYDVILCSHVLEHLADPVGFLTIMRCCLKPAGVFIGLVPLNERKMDIHHVQLVDRQKIDSWVEQSGFAVRTYREGDPWFYWVQPMLSSEKGLPRMLAQGLSLAIGLPATVLGPKWWARVSRLFGALSGSLPTQAGFVLAQKELL
jgi:2-polyprenyl-3-methyl-5-hydroxy-6-metoxy-1,4-benzoquinol methylase